jgi:hypothetical protein
VRVAVPSPVDRSIMYTDTHFIPFYTPTIQSVDPASVPLSGGILNIRGHSFGNGGRVYTKQRLYYKSTSVPGDPVYAGLHAVPHEVDTVYNVNGAYLGMTGLTIGVNNRTLASPAVADALAEGAVLAAKHSKVSNDPQYADRYIFQECFLLNWNQTFIRCLAQPGIDNLTNIVIDVGWGQGSKQGLLFQVCVCVCVFV